MTHHVSNELEEDYDPGRPFSDMRSTGLLWMLNRLLHPWGYALAFHTEPCNCCPEENREVIGWSIMGDGSEPWKFGDDVPEDELFSQVMALFEETRNEES